MQKPYTHNPDARARTQTKTRLQFLFDRSAAGIIQRLFLPRLAPVRIERPFFGRPRRLIKKSVATIAAASILGFATAHAGENVLALNFVLTHPTPVSAIGARDGGAPFTFTETVGIFSDATGGLVGAEAVFGPGEIGIQIGDVFFERIPRFILSPGDYSLISISGGSLPGGGGLAGGDSYQNLGSDLNLPEGGRFNFGTGFDTSPGTGPRGQLQPFFLADLVPDSGATGLLLGASFAGVAWARRKF